MKIAIHPDTNPGKDGSVESSAERWAALARQAEHEVVMVDVFRNDIIDRLRDCDGFMWRHKHSARDRAVARRLLPVLEDQLGLCVYPDQATCWHYDDKIAQFYLLCAAGIPMPRTWVFWDKNEADAFVETANYPLVLKLWSGAGASNVVLVRSQTQARELVRRLFYPGVRSLTSPVAQGRLPWNRRVRDAARLFLRGEAPNPGENWELHKDYALFQEFLPDNAFDTRVTVIGNRAFAYRRFNRPDDFRASGSGNFDTDPSVIDQETVRLAFRLARALGTQSVAIDGLRRGDERVVCEISYTYVSWMVQSCPGHWTLSNESDANDLVWRDGPMWPEEAQMADFLQRMVHWPGRRK